MQGFNYEKDRWYEDSIREIYKQLLHLEKEQLELYKNLRLLLVIIGAVVLLSLAVLYDIGNFLGAIN